MTELALGHLIDNAASGDELAHLLREDLPLYEGCGTNQVIRMRGYILAAFERTGLPTVAVPYVLEELQSGHAPYLVAAAAKAVRGWARPSAELPIFLARAARNIAANDDAVTFDTIEPHWPVPNATSAMREIFRTLAWLGAQGIPTRTALERIAAQGRFSPAVQAEFDRAAVHAAAAPRQTAPPAKRSCCSSPPSLVTLGAATGDAIRLQDQDGNAFAFDHFFRGKPSVVVFFYTRCNNPNKCSLTVTNLARLQHLLATEGLDVRTAGISYDPDFDTPERLKGYGLARGVRFGQDHRLLRAQAGFDTLRQRFELGVNYSAATVNHHRIELLVLDAAGQVVHQHTRLQWEPEEIAGLLRPTS